VNQSRKTERDWKIEKDIDGDRKKVIKTEQRISERDRKI
jgi:hypothetical protein